MSGIIYRKTYPQPPVCRREILRYAGCRQGDEELERLLDACLEEALPRLRYQVCWRFLNAEEQETFLRQSRLLEKNLSGCREVVLLASTVGVELDRLIARYSHLSPTKALLVQAIGAERIEALCDRFCADLAAQRALTARPRFSPGYGDLPLQAQQQIFALLDCPRTIGLFLNESLLMSPSKSVTAFLGLAEGEQTPTVNKCAACRKQDCAFRESP